MMCVKADCWYQLVYRFPFISELMSWAPSIKSWFSQGLGVPWAFPYQVRQNAKG